MLTCCFAARAAGDPANQLFQDGRAAFEAQDYAKALQAFEAALAAGLSGPAVHFNIGVTAFRLGDYSRATTAFEETARTPTMAAIAHYNLGLVALRRSDTAAAGHWFALAKKESADERLRDLATSQLAALPPPPVRQWVGYGALAAGYDDNVALIASSDALGVSGSGDSFAELQLAAAMPLDGPWRFDAGLFMVDYMDLNQFDQLGLQGGARYRFDLGSWDNEAGAQLGYTTLNGKGFENLQTLALQSSTQLNHRWNLRARYRFANIDGMNGFEGLTGHRQDLGLKLDWRYEPWSVGFEYRYENGDYDDPALSAAQQLLDAEVQRNFSNGWALALEAVRRHTRYDDSSIGIEDRSEISVALTKSLNRTWRLAVRYSFADNDADLALYDYRRNRFSAGVEAVL